MFSAVCDLCGSKVTTLDKIATITPDYQIEGRVVHICQGCGKKVNKQLNHLRQLYAHQLAQDVRTWLLEYKASKRNR